MKYNIILEKLNRKARLKMRYKNFMLYLRKIPRAWGGELTLAESTLSAKLIRGDGTTVDYGIVCRRKVLDQFVAFIVAQLVTETSAFGDFKYHRAGIDTATEASDDVFADFNFTGCPAAISDGTQVAGGSGSARTYTSVGTISFTSTLAITSHGLANGSDFSTATIMDRSVFAAINVVNGDSIQFTYVLTINSEV